MTHHIPGSFSPTSQSSLIHRVGVPLTSLFTDGMPHPVTSETAEIGAFFTDHNRFELIRIGVRVSL